LQRSPIQSEPLAGRPGRSERMPGSWYSMSSPDPHFEGAFHTGGEILIVQYPGPSTGERPIYAGRFNMDKRKALAEERVDL
jgi:hypothetical protein